MNSPEEIAIDFVRVNLSSYLTGSPGCDLDWIKLIISISGIQPSDLANIFIDMDEFGDRKRYRKIFKICRNVKFDHEAIR
jgi:hypothetical protein